MPKISVILPTYNERENIENIINSIFNNMDTHTEVIVVDDNSPDRTWEVVEKIEKSNNNVRLLRRMNKRGLTSAISEGIFLSEGDIVVWMDCDFSMPPEVIPKLIYELNDNDIALGSRYVNQGKDARDSFIRVLASRAVNMFASFVLDSSIKDYSSGFFAVKRDVFDEIKLMPEGYAEYCVDFLYRAKRKGFKIKEVPYITIDRKVGETKTSPNVLTFLRHGVVYIFTVLKLRVVVK